MTTIDMLPSEMNTYATMRMGEDDFNTYDKVKKWAIKYVKVQRLQKRKNKGIHVYIECGF